MPNRNILKDTAYIYHFIGEVEYEATYAKYTVKNCSLQSRDGVSRTGTETAPRNTAKLYIFDRDTTITDSAGNRLTWIEPDKYEALTPEEKATRWTIGNDEKDYFGETGSESETPTTGAPNYYKVTGYKRNDTGSKRIHYVEVDGQ